MKATHPSLAAELHPTKNGKWNAENLTAGTHKRLWWLCLKCQHEWINIGGNRSRLGQGCPACSNKVVHIDGRNSMAKTSPKLAEELHPTKNGNWNGNNLVTGSARKMWWVCKIISSTPCEHEWATTVASHSASAGCPMCSIPQKAVHIDGRNSMAGTHPELAAELHPDKNGKWNADNLITVCEKCVVAMFRMRA